MLMRNSPGAPADRLGASDPSVERVVHPAIAAPVENVPKDGVVFIGKGSKLVGDLSDCTVVDIHGAFEGTIVANTVVIRESGVFKGTMVTDQAEVHGVVEGTVTVHELLDMRASGTASGELTYGRLSVADGGNIFGNLNRLQPVVAGHGEADNVVSLNNVVAHEDGSTLRWQT
jgi:cytoskeletal protein CcmA (bactofilin family)